MGKRKGFRVPWLVGRLSGIFQGGYDGLRGGRGINVRDENLGSSVFEVLWMRLAGSKLESENGKIVKGQFQVS